MKREASVNKI